MINIFSLLVYRLHLDLTTSPKFCILYSVCYIVWLTPDSGLTQPFILILIAKHYVIPQPRTFCTKHCYFNMYEKCFASDKISAKISYIFWRSRMKHSSAGILANILPVGPQFLIYNYKSTIQSNPVSRSLYNLERNFRVNVPALYCNITHLIKGNIFSVTFKWSSWQK